MILRSQAQPHHSGGGGGRRVRSAGGVPLCRAQARPLRLSPWRPDRQRRQRRGRPFLERGGRPLVPRRPTRRGFGAALPHAPRSGFPARAPSRRCSASKPIARRRRTFMRRCGCSRSRPRLAATSAGPACFRRGQDASVAARAFRPRHVLKSKRPPGRRAACPRVHRETALPARPGTCEPAEARSGPSEPAERGHG